MDTFDKEDMREISAEMAELDLDLPFQTFWVALERADIDDRGRKSLMEELTALMTSYRDGQNEYYRKVYKVYSLT